MLTRHILDLANTCYYRGIPTASDFLSLEEQSQVQKSMREFPPVRYHWNGGTESAERRRIEFYPEGAELEDPAPSFFSDAENHSQNVHSLFLIKIEPKSQKFAEELTHRDYLGSIMNLGIERGKFGDLLLHSGACYVICTQTAAAIVTEQLSRVRHTSVVCSYVEGSPEEIGPNLKEIRTTVASMRADCILSSVFHISRGTASELIRAEKLYINGKSTLSSSAALKEGDIISLRGYGKCKIGEIGALTKKGRTSLIVFLYQ